jgi:hypothetical protein
VGNKFLFWSSGCSLLREEGFSFSLAVLYGGLRIRKLQFFDQKRFWKISAVFFLQVLVTKTLHPDPDSLEMLDPDPYPDWMNPDPQHWGDGKVKFLYLARSFLQVAL